MLYSTVRPFALIYFTLFFFGMYRQGDDKTVAKRILKTKDLKDYKS